MDFPMEGHVQPTEERRQVQYESMAVFLRPSGPSHVKYNFGGLGTRWRRVSERCDPTQCQRRTTLPFKTVGTATIEIDQNASAKKKLRRSKIKGGSGPQSTFLFSCASIALKWVGGLVGATQNKAGGEMRAHVDPLSKLGLDRSNPHRATENHRASQRSIFRAQNRDFVSLPQRMLNMHKHIPK